MTQAKPRLTCRVCDQGNLRAVLDLGSMPLANRLLTRDQIENLETEPRYPLALNFCANCGLVQLSHVVPASALYTDYPFLTSSSRSMVEHFGKLMNESANTYVPQDGLVVEIGSNDGSALSSLRGRPIRVMGVDPALNIDAGDVPTHRDFFTPEVANQIAEYNGQAHLIVACNVLAHVDDLHEFMGAVKTLLHPEGAFVVEVPHLRGMLKDTAYDQIYAEHLSYFSATTLKHLMRQHGMYVECQQGFVVHGGTIRVTALPKVGDSEDGYEMFTIDWQAQLQEFARKTVSCRENLKAQIGEFHWRGKEIIAYGASAKGAIVLNYCEIGTDLIPLVIDNTPYKQGRFMPGTHQQIVAPEAVNLADYDVVLLLAWNHKEEIEPKLREAGFAGKVIVPHG